MVGLPHILSPRSEDVRGKRRGVRPANANKQSKIKGKENPSIRRQRKKDPGFPFKGGTRIYSISKQRKKRLVVIVVLVGQSNAYPRYRVH